MPTDPQIAARLRLIETFHSEAVASKLEGADGPISVPYYTVKRVGSDGLWVHTSSTDKTHRIRFAWIRGDVRTYPHRTIVWTLRAILGIEAE